MFPENYAPGFMLSLGLYMGLMRLEWM